MWICPFCSQVRAGNNFASFPGFSSLTVDVCHITKSTIQNHSWARATWILFVVLYKHWENKIPFLPMKRNTCFSNQQEHFSQNWCIPVGKLFIDSWWQHTLSCCLDRWKRHSKTFNLTYGDRGRMEQVCYVYHRIITTNQREHTKILHWWLQQSFSGICESIVGMVSLNIKRYKAPKLNFFFLQYSRS